MGIISIETSSRLIWLGRYTERTFTIAKTLGRTYDTMLDTDEFAYRRFLDLLGLPYIYGSRDAFVEHYFFDPKDPNSLMSQLYRAYDNAVELREELSSETLCYIQMAVDELRGGSPDDAPMLTLMQLQDDLFAFWGSADDNVESEECRNLLKCGKYIERLDLYVRLGYSYPEVVKETSKLIVRLKRAGLSAAHDAELKLRWWTKDEETYRASKQELLSLLWNLME